MFWQNWNILGAFTNFRKVIICFVMAVSWLPLARLKKNWYFNLFQKLWTFHAWLNTYNDYIKRTVPLAQYVSEFFIEWEILQNKIVEEIKNALFFNKSFLKKYLLWNNAEKHAGIRHGIHDNIIQRRRFACSIDKARNTHSEYVVHTHFPRQQQLHIPTTM